MHSQLNGHTPEFTTQRVTQSEYRINHACEMEQKFHLKLHVTLAYSLAKYTCTMKIRTKGHDSERHNTTCHTPAVYKTIIQYKLHGVTQLNYINEDTLQTHVPE